MGDNGGDTEEKGVPVSKEFDDLPDDIGELQGMLREAEMQLRKVQLELDVRQATLEIVKKDPGADPELLTNAEKAAMVEALRPRYRLCEILPVVRMAKSSYEYARNAQMKGEAEEHAAARGAVIAAFDASGGTCGYRRITAVVGVGEWTVRDIMRDEGLVACAAKKKRRYSSYEGEVSAAPPNLLRDERGKHHFRADNPNELWITDVTEFRIPAGKVCLSPVVDCFDGMPLSWSISTSPDADMANSSLLGACMWLGEGDHTKVHSDRGGHYCRPGWIKICDENGLVRSMSRKGCSDIPQAMSKANGLTCDPSYHVQVGETVWAYGFADGKRVLRCLEAHVAESYDDGRMIRVDRAFIEGMSGGPAANAKGDVIGIILNGSAAFDYTFDGEFLSIGAIEGFDW